MCPSVHPSFDRVGIVLVLGTVRYASHPYPRSSTAPYAPKRFRRVQSPPSRLTAFSELPIALQLSLHLVHAVNHGRVIAAAKRLADFDELHLQDFPREIHGDLARHRE